MSDLANLYKSAEKFHACQECNVFKSLSLANFDTICHKDWERLDECDILYVFDSFRVEDGAIKCLSSYEYTIYAKHIQPFIPKQLKVHFTVSVKCPNIKEQDIDTNSKDICRNYLLETLKITKPKLIFAAGNLALKMLTKKSGIIDKRGRLFYTHSMYGNEIPVVPIYHPSMVAMEPKYAPLLEQDTRNFINKIIYKQPDYEGEYILVNSIGNLKNLVEKYNLAHTNEPISIDTETTGLNFLTKRLLTIAMSFMHEGKFVTFVVPYLHKDHVWREEELKEVVQILNSITLNTNNKKILQNAKFDWKFMRKVGIEFNNVWDTMIMSHLINENLPKSLYDLGMAESPDETPIEEKE